MRSFIAAIFSVGVGVGFVAFAPNAQSTPVKGKAEHVVVVVWDGMRPDLISQENTPTLFQLAGKGVTFKNHHAVYVSTTEVNATAIATGMYPEHSGIIANDEYRPAINSTRTVVMQNEETIRRGDELYDVKFIATPTLAEIIQRAGFRTAVAGTKSVAILWDRSDRRTSEASQASVDLCKGRALPLEAMAILKQANGSQPFPTTVTSPNTAQDLWTTRALTRGLWEKDVPKFSVLWMSDPDYTQHDNGVGSPDGLAAVKSADNNLALVLKTLEEKNVRDKTDIFVVSDHGFSTVERHVDMEKELVNAGFKATKKFEKTPAKGEVLVESLSGSISLYVIGHDKKTIRRLVNFLQASDYAGVIFSHQSLPGTFSMEQVRVNTTNAPDVLVSLRWNGEKNKFGIPGMLISDSKNDGNHASLSPFDLHNMLVTSGPDFKSGYTTALATGNIDLAPTILWILGIKSPQPMDGRILSEAISGLNAPPAKVKQKTIEASVQNAAFRWRQYLKFSTVGKTTYFDEGNGAVEKK